MAAKKSNTDPIAHLLDPNTVIDVFKIKGDRIQHKQMTHGQAIKNKKEPGWRYVFYQVGFSSLKATE